MVLNLKYAETYTPSIVSESCIYIAEIYFQIWTSENEKKLKIVGFFVVSRSEPNFEIMYLTRNMRERSEN